VCFLGCDCSSSNASGVHRFSCLILCGSYFYSTYSRGYRDRPTTNFGLLQLSLSIVILMRLVRLESNAERQVEDSVEPIFFSLILYAFGGRKF